MEVDDDNSNESDLLEEPDIMTFLSLIYSLTNERPQVCDDKLFKKITDLFDTFYNFPTVPEDT
jgi:hypothetical protein